MVQLFAAAPEIGSLKHLRDGLKLKTNFDAMRPRRLECAAAKLIAAALALSSAGAFAQTLEKFGASFADQMDKECRAIQFAAPQNQRMSVGQIAQYCSCIARHSVEVITMDEIFSLQRSGQRPDSMQKKLNAMGQACADVVSGKAIDQPLR
jgi:hypothetical protein